MQSLNSRLSANYKLAPACHSDLLTKTRMNLHGNNFIGEKLSATGTTTFSAVNPASGETLAPKFSEATREEIDSAVALAAEAFETLSALPAEQIAAFLDQVAEELLRLGPDLIARAQAETGLPEARLLMERGRTVGQIKMFADLIREGSWLEATIDRAIPDRKPFPKADLRRMLIPIGPVAIFGASNFPLAFSVPGGDTISALAAGNPVIVKAHPAHPGTSELVAQAFRLAITATKMPAGIFSMVHGVSHDVGLHLVRHPQVKAVGFTGSLKAGRALFDAAAARPEPIPVYAEMGSTNPVFILPGALKKNGAAIAEGLVQSVTMGVGQFCTNPGLAFGLNGADLNSFLEKAGQVATNAPSGTMLYQNLCANFNKGIAGLENVSGVRVVGKSAATDKQRAPATVFTTNAQTFLANEVLHEELFGPSTLVVSCDSATDFEKIARALPGQLTATIHGTEEDLAQHKNLVSILQQKVGRLLFNGFPTGVEVCPSMHHGGPYPATTNPMFTSVGTAAIKRFARPICFQSFPDSALPTALQNKNRRNVWRLVDSKLTKDDLVG
ncbi:MAG: aldH [Verrucomicrobiales bacterium]|nr:aldH [Verrucomicrobiales bacterium]